MVSFIPNTLFVTPLSSSTQLISLMRIFVLCTKLTVLSTKIMPLSHTTTYDPKLRRRLRCGPTSLHCHLANNTVTHQTY